MIELDWKKIKEFYSLNGIFTCSQRGRRRDSSELEEKIDISVANCLYPPASKNTIDKLQNKIQKQLPPSYRELLEISNGGVFFFQQMPRINPFLAAGYKLFARTFKPLFERILFRNSGFRFYSTKEIPIAQNEVGSWLREIFEEEQSDWFDSPDDPNKQMCLDWLDNFLVIGDEIGSDNYIAIDYCRKSEAQEYPVIYMEHEVPLSYCDPDDDNPVIANSIMELLQIAAKDPANFLMKTLGGLATYSDGKTSNQWYPISYRSLSPEEKAPR